MSNIPPHPALKPMKDETLRLLMAEEEGDYIAGQIKRTKRWIWIASTIGVFAPMIPIVLFVNEAYVFEQLFAIHAAAVGAGVVGSFVGIVAPFWAAVRVGFEVQALRRYRDYQSDHAAFLTSHNRCPLEVRRG